MRRQILAFLLFTLFAAFASAQQNGPIAINCTQFMAWTAGGMSSSRLIRLAQQRGIAFRLDAAITQSLLTAGVEPALLQNLHTIEGASSNSGSGKSDDGGCPAPLALAGELISIACRVRWYPEALPL